MTTFADELRRAMEAQRMSVAQLSDLTLFSESTISYWLAGSRMPTLERADLVADLLDAPNVRIAATQAYSRRCVRCRRRFLANAKNRQRALYCGTTCRTAVARANRDQRELTGRRLRTADLERAVAAFCGECEPEGLCRMAACALRPVSPLPLVPFAVPRVLPRTPSRGVA